MLIINIVMFYIKSYKSIKIFLLYSCHHYIRFIHVIRVRFILSESKRISAPAPCERKSCDSARAELSLLKLCRKATGRRALLGNA